MIGDDKRRCQRLRAHTCPDPHAGPERAGGCAPFQTGVTAHRCCRRGVRRGGWRPRGSSRWHLSRQAEVRQSRQSMQTAGWSGRLKFGVI